MQELVNWYRGNQRDLPWRNNTDPYSVWISEIILQQTRVAQGLPFYQRFMEELPIVADLAAAEEQKVLSLWQGLGYYSRARNLHTAAKQIINERKGIFPENYLDLLQLKGVGPYTAAAIASICFQEPVPAIDGNAFRVYARFYNIDLDISKASTRSYFFELGKEIMPSQLPGDFNQAVMDLGSQICTPSNPSCENCPLEEKCLAFSLNKQSELPVKTKKIKIRNREFNYLYIHHETDFLLCLRKEKDIWQHLYDFPQATKDSESLTLIHEDKHLLSHQRLQLFFWDLAVSKKELQQLKTIHSAQIVSLEKLKELPLPKPIEKFTNLMKINRL